MAKSNVLNKFKNGLRRAGGFAYSVGHEFAQVPTKFYVAAAVALPVISQAQSMASGGVLGNLKGTVNNVIGVLVIAAVLAGIAAIMYGLTQLVKKGMGRGDDVEWRQVYWPIGAGAFLTILMWFVEGVVSDSGGSVSDMGATRNF